MVIETDILNFWDWLAVGSDERAPALLQFVVTIVVLALVGLLFGFLIAAVRHGPIAAGDLVYRVLRRAAGELFRISPRRVWALARLSVKESLRKSVLASLIVFGVLLVFAPWFLGSESREPVKLYLSFVMTASMYLTLLIALLLSTFSLPADIKSKTIYTVVTKPVGAHEIVLGRILGFTIIGTVLLAIMGAGGYVFVIRSLRHTHTIAVADLAEAKASGVQRGLSSRDMGHRHEATVDKDGHVDVQSAIGHWHDVAGEPENGAYVTSSPADMYRARVPIYGKLRFKDRNGADKDRGVSVGNEWGYRSYIDGGTSATAIWTFDSLREEEYPDGLPLELSLRVFRTYKGDIERGILGSLVVVNPTTGLRSDIRTFRAQDFHIDEQTIPRKLPRRRQDMKPGLSEELDLFDDLVDEEGRVEIWIQCVEPAQYFGAAQADCYIRTRDGLFWVNYWKGLSGTWAQMVLIVCFGVMFSTFLSGPVALFATAGCFILGTFRDFIIKVATGGIEGGGPVEAMIRTFTQQNMTSELEAGGANALIETLDSPLKALMHGLVYVLPDFSSYSQVNWVAYGYNIPWNLIAQNLMAGFAYLLGAFIAGYLFLRSGEVAK
ncbi:MAG: hypothetical protein KDA42_03585 [Planctomycetales bacterium]|nr:hypothetical protein [Planctomycetales bacterium]